MGHWLIFWKKSPPKRTPSLAPPDNPPDPLTRGGANVVMLVLVVLTLSLVVHFVRQVVQSTHLDARRIALETENALIEEELVSLRGAVDYAGSDVYVERMAREQLGYAHEGDVVLVPQFEVTDEETTPAPAALPLPSPAPNWHLWWRSLNP